jgi:hypothetical protein
VLEGTQLLLLRGAASVPFEKKTGRLRARAVTVKAKKGSNTLNMVADSKNPSGVKNAAIAFYDPAPSTFTATSSGPNSVFVAPAQVSGTAPVITWP